MQSAQSQQANSSVSGASRPSGAKKARKAGEFYREHAKRILEKNGASASEPKGPFEVKLWDSKKHPVIKDNGGSVFAVVLPGLRGAFNLRKEGARKFGRKIRENLSEKAGVKGFVDTDNFARFKLPKEDAERARRQAGADEKDSVIIIAARQMKDVFQAFEVLTDKIGALTEQKRA